MKKISYEEAKKLILSGDNNVKAVVSRTKIPVKTLNDLENLNHLAEEKVQNYELFYEPVDISIPKTAMEIGLDDAIILSHKGEAIYSFLNNTEIKLSSPSDVKSHYAGCNIHGIPCVLYWYVS